MKLPTWLPTPLRSALKCLKLRWPPTRETLRAAFRREALVHHPGSHEGFVALTTAKEAVEAALADGLPRPPNAGPKRKRKRRPDPGPERPRREAAYRAFRSGFRRSRRGNHWREWRGEVLTVFLQRNRYQCCIADENGPRYSRRSGFSTEEVAVRALWEVLTED
jgi:hypothetical protein